MALSLLYNGNSDTITVRKKKQKENERKHYIFEHLFSFNFYTEIYNFLTTTNGRIEGFLNQVKQTSVLCKPHFTYLRLFQRSGPCACWGTWQSPTPSLQQC